MAYNRQEVGMRLRCRRQEMGMTGESIGKMIGKNGRYYRDIENGRCGMSVDTLMFLSTAMGLSIDYIIYGTTADGGDGELEEQKVVARMLSHCNEHIKEGAVNLLKVYLETVSE